MTSSLIAVVGFDERRARRTALAYRVLLIGLWVTLTYFGYAVGFFG
jgi:hypothetical protein